MKVENSSFSLYEQALTNEAVTITYKPSATVSSYSYKIYKDDELYEEATISTNKSYNILLEESGDYYISVTLKQNDGKVVEDKSGHYIIDLDPPYILEKESYITLYTLKKDETFDVDILKKYLTVKDKQDGDLLENLQCNFEDIDFTKVGNTKLECTVSDKAGNTTEKEILLKIEKNRTVELNTMIGIIIGFILFFLVIFVRFQRSISLEKKLVKYTITPLHDKGPSIFDKIANKIYKIILFLDKLLSKSVFIKKLSSKYEKYAPLYNNFNQGIDFISCKFLVSILFAFVCILANILHYYFMNIYEIILPIILGFFLPDILYIIKYKLYRRKCENDLLQAIIIMNNAFKSGRSITQAIELVTKELDGPIGQEFKKMHMEISFGLSIEEVFERFSNRINLEEVTYLTASLSILNRTGGNIIKVFSSIEKTLFDKKKLRLELAALTGSSKIIVYVLFAVPLLFILFISLVSPGYFSPFYTTQIGKILMFIMILIYIVYIWFINKIMKVRM